MRQSTKIITAILFLDYVTEFSDTTGSPGMYKLTYQNKSLKVVKISATHNDDQSRGGSSSLQHQSWLGYKLKNLTGRSSISPDRDH
jgi:hypothetical protein